MRGLAVLLLVLSLPIEPLAQQRSRFDRIKARGTVGCGIEPSVPGFSDVDGAGRYHGLDIDICRAIAAAVLGTADKVSFVPVRTVAEFRTNPLVDVVARRLTWELSREHPLGLLFGPITFYDGQSFLVPSRSGVTNLRALSTMDVCVAGGTVFEVNANEFFGTYRKVIVESPHAYRDIADALSSGHCQAYTGDVSDLGVIRSLLTTPTDFTILADRISQEPLAPLVRDDDPQWFDIVRWTVFALIEAEQLGVTSANADEMLVHSQKLDVKRLLGAVGGNGAALGLAERWALDAIKGVGNYGEIFDRNLGRGSRIGLDRGLNRLARDGGLMYAPPLR